MKDTFAFHHLNNEELGNVVLITIIILSNNNGRIVWAKTYLQIIPRAPLYGLSFATRGRAATAIYLMESHSILELLRHAQGTLYTSSLPSPDPSRTETDEAQCNDVGVDAIRKPESCAAPAHEKLVYKSNFRQPRNPQQPTSQ